jgi:hypothetical protein
MQVKVFTLKCMGKEVNRSELETNINSWLTRGAEKYIIEKIVSSDYFLFVVYSEVAPI